MTKSQTGKARAAPARTTALQEIKTRKYIAIEDIHRGKSEMVVNLEKVIQNATEILDCIKSSAPGERCGNPDMYKWLETYVDSIRKNNLEWVAASQVLYRLEELEVLIADDIAEANGKELPSAKKEG